MRESITADYTLQTAFEKSMKSTPIVLILITTWLCACSRAGSFRTAKDSHRQISLIHDLERSSGYRYIYTDTTYANSTGSGITIQNSVRKGGMMEPETPYVDSVGKRYFFTATWTRIINGTNSTLDLKVNFPADSFPLSAPAGSYLKLLIPPDTMTIDRLPLFSYGLTGMKSFVAAHWDHTTTLQMTIEPNEEHMFYIVGLAYKTEGPARSAIILKEKELFYSTHMGPHGPLVIPCGTVALKNEACD